MRFSRVLPAFYSPELRVRNHSCPKHFVNIKNKVKKSHKSIERMYLLFKDKFKSLVDIFSRRSFFRLLADLEQP